MSCHSGIGLLQDDDDDDDDDEYGDDDEDETALEGYETVLEQASCDVDEYVIFKEVLSCMYQFFSALSLILLLRISQ